MEAPGPASDVRYFSRWKTRAIIAASCSTEDFALTEAAYMVVRLLHRFPGIRFLADQKIEIVGVERQTMTLVLSSTEDCLVDLAGGDTQGQDE